MCQTKFFDNATFSLKGSVSHFRNFSCDKFVGLSIYITTVLISRFRKDSGRIYDPIFLKFKFKLVLFRCQSKSTIKLLVQLGRARDGDTNAEQMK